MYSLVRQSYWQCQQKLLCKKPENSSYNLFNQLLMLHFMKVAHTSTTHVYSNTDIATNVVDKSIMNFKTPATGRCTFGGGLRELDELKFSPGLKMELRTECPFTFVWHHCLFLRLKCNVALAYYIFTQCTTLQW